METPSGDDMNTKLLREVPGTGTHVARDRENGQCPRKGGPECDCFDGVALDGCFVPVFTLGDEEIIGLVAEFISPSNHVGLEPKQELVSSRPVPLAVKRVSDLGFEPPIVRGIVVGISISGRADRLRLFDEGSPICSVE